MSNTLTNVDSLGLVSSSSTILVGGSNPKGSIILTAAGGAPTTTIPCGGPTKNEAGTNDIDYYTLDFDNATEERAFWNVIMPDNYDGGTITAVFYWTNAAGGAAETVDWGIKAGSWTNDDALDAAYGTEITTTDTWIAQGDLHVSASSSAVTIAGTPAGGDLVIFNVGRKVATDDLTGDAQLIAVKIKYGISKFSDE